MLADCGQNPTATCISDLCLTDDIPPRRITRLLSGLESPVVAKAMPGKRRPSKAWISALYLTGSLDLGLARVHPEDLDLALAFCRDRPQ